VVSAARPSLHDLVVRWLERTPFVSTSAEESEDGQPFFSFWQHYKDSVARMLEQDRLFIQDGIVADMSEERRAQIEKQLSELDKRADHLDIIMSPEKFEAARARGEVRCDSHRPNPPHPPRHTPSLLLRFSQQAMQAALIINLYQEEPILHQASRLLRALVDIDELMTLWRQRHALMVHRMLGTLASLCRGGVFHVAPSYFVTCAGITVVGIKMGTGGSSGFAYLTDAANKHRVFKDLFNLSTFLIPTHELPPLPQHIVEQLSFTVEVKAQKKRAT
jgi:tryptophan 2,3-dioxygenase